MRLVALRPPPHKGDFVVHRLRISTQEDGAGAPVLFSDLHPHDVSIKRHHPLQVADVNAHVTKPHYACHLRLLRVCSRSYLLTHTLVATVIPHCNECRAEVQANKLCYDRTQILSLHERRILLCCNLHTSADSDSWRGPAAGRSNTNAPPRGPASTTPASPR